MLSDVTRDCRGDTRDVSRVIQDHRTRGASSKRSGCKAPCQPDRRGLVRSVTWLQGRSRVLLLTVKDLDGGIPKGKAGDCRGSDGQTS